jgi:vanillate/3-O-methylgallate O-demethylase
VIERARFEIMPFARGEEEARELPEHVRLTVTASPKHGLDHTVEVATRLRALGHAVTVHLAARMIRDRDHLDALLAAMAQAGVDDAFVIGGDTTPPHGQYASAVELLPLVHRHPLRPRTIGIAGYPEGHPLIDSATLAEALEEKSRLADYVTTQLCFDPDAVVGWVRAARRAGLALPVIVGLPGVVDRRKLLEISMRVGVGPSLSFLRKQGGVRNLLRLSGGSVEGLHDALVRYVGDPHFDIAGFHYFTFNRLLDTWSWEREKRLRRNSIHPEPRKEADVTHHTLEHKLQAAGSAVEMARNSQIGPYVYPKVPAEFTNWRDEQVAWRQTCALFDQTHHMTDLYIEGPDVIRLLSALGVNTFENFAVNKAKQFVCCNNDGFVIGDGILFFLDENRVNLVGRPSAHNWVQYHAETGDYDVTLDRDERTAANPTGKRKIYRFQVQGPTAHQTLERANGGPLPEIKFFNMGELTIGGHKVRALHHGMSGVPGLELFGPWDESEDVRAAIVEAGADFGLRQVGSRVYATNTLESGWIPCPLPAIFTGDELKAYREWLPADGYEATGSLGGSFYSDDISDYYLTPHDLGYWPFVKFDHDFVGRKALEEMGDEPKRRKVTLAWNGEDVARAMETMFHGGNAAKYIDLPLSNYSTWPNDKVLRDGAMVGVSTFSGYSYNERSMLSLAILDTDVEIGTEVTLVWGEEGGGSAKPVVERHTQAEIRAIVSPCPYSVVARTSYAEGWRTRAEVA